MTIGVEAKERPEEPSAEARRSARALACAVVLVLISRGGAYSMTEGEFREAYAKGCEELRKIYSQYEMSGVTRYPRTPPATDEVVEFVLARKRERAVYRTRRPGEGNDVRTVRLWDRGQSFVLEAKKREFVLTDAGVYSSVEDLADSDLVGLVPFGHYLLANVPVLLADPDLRITRIESVDEEVSVHWEKAETDPEQGRFTVTGTWRFAPQRNWLFLGSTVNLADGKACIKTVFDYGPNLAVRRAQFSSLNRRTGEEKLQIETEVTGFQFSSPDDEVFTASHYGVELAPSRRGPGVVVILGITLAAMVVLYLVQRFARRWKSV